MTIRRLSRGNLQFILGVCLGLSVSLGFFQLQQLTRPESYMEKTIVAETFSEDVGTMELEADLSQHKDNDTRAKELYGRVRVLVWVMTGPQNLDKRAVHVRNTWGRRANKLLFMSSVWNHTFPTIGLDVPEGRDHLTAKTMKAFRYVYDHHLDDADWFMKADDDTYVIMENLRYLLSTYSTQDPVYFGKVFRLYVQQGYASGGAGYVLSKEALRRLVTMGKDSSLCHQDGGLEDISIGRCLSKLNVKLLPSTDHLGRSRFHCFGPEAHLQGGFPKWFLRYDVHGGRTAIDLSDYAISFHRVKSTFMYALEFLIYHMRPFGIVSGTQDLNVDSDAVVDSSGDAVVSFVHMV